MSSTSAKLHTQQRHLPPREIGRPNYLLLSWSLFFYRHPQVFTYVLQTTRHFSATSISTQPRLSMWWLTPKHRGQPDCIPAPTHNDASSETSHGHDLTANSLAELNISILKLDQENQVCGWCFPSDSQDSHEQPLTPGDPPESWRSEAADVDWEIIQQEAQDRTAKEKAKVEARNHLESRYQEARVIAARKFQESADRVLARQTAAAAGVSGLRSDGASVAPQERTDAGVARLVTNRARHTTKKAQMRRLCKKVKRSLRKLVD